LDAAACLAYAAIGRAAVPLVAPAELAERATALDRGELSEGDARRTLHDLGLVAAALSGTSSRTGATGSATTRREPTGQPS
jgi:hypothetical protein